MATIWITYAWVDNESNDVDFVAQELGDAGVDVRLDRWNLQSGSRLWTQIDEFISDPRKSDAWLLIATQNSLSSEACKEEYAYALDRALSLRGDGFPVIALFLGDVDDSLIPAGIRTRLYVSITDPDWKERIRAAAEGREADITHDRIQPYLLEIHRQEMGDWTQAIEVRPRAGVWAPFVAAVPFNEKDDVAPTIMCGPAGVPTGSGMLVGRNDGQSGDGKYWVMGANNQATPTQSYYVWCKRLPSELVFGVKGGTQFSYLFHPTPESSAVASPKITSEMVKALREETGFGVMKCKRALIESAGDFETAKQILSSG